MHAFIANLDLRLERLRERVEGFQPGEVLTDRYREAVEDYETLEKFLRALRAGERKD